MKCTRVNEIVQIDDDHVHNGYGSVLVIAICYSCAAIVHRRRCLSLVARQPIDEPTKEREADCYQQTHHQKLSLPKTMENIGTTTNPIRTLALELVAVVAGTINIIAPEIEQKTLDCT